jgi:hypothetical protein
MAAWPHGRTPPLSGAFSSTSVLATDGDGQNTIPPAIRLQPHAIASSAHRGRRRNGWQAGLR